MSRASIPIYEVSESLKHTFKGIDLRAVCFKEDDQLRNALIVLRLVYQGPALISRHHRELYKRFGSIETNNLKVLIESYEIAYLPKLCEQLSNEKIEIMGREIFLGKSIRISAMKGYIEDYVRNLKDMGKYAGSCIEVTEGSRSRLFDNESIRREIGVLGYSDVYSAINGMLEINFSGSSGFDFLIYIPIYATIENIAYEGRAVVAKGRCHENLCNLSLRLLLAKRYPYKGDMVEKNIPGQISAGKPLHNFRFWRARITVGDLLPEYLIELKLLNHKLGELCSKKTQLKEIMGEAERSPLFSILKLFCREEDLGRGLLEPQKVKKHSARVFERSIAWLLSLLGFSVIWLQEYEKLREPSTKVEYGSIDVLGFHKGKGMLALVNCTIGVPKDNELDQLIEAKRIIEERHAKNTKVKIVPIIFSAAKQIDNIRKKGVQTGIQIFDGNEIQSIMETIKRGDENAFFDSLFNVFFSKLRVH